MSDQIRCPTCHSYNVEGGRLLSFSQMMNPNAPDVSAIAYSCKNVHCGQMFYLDNTPQG